MAVGAAYEVIQGLVLLVPAPLICAPTKGRIDLKERIRRMSNKIGQALFGADNKAFMISLHLRNADGSDFDPDRLVNGRLTDASEIPQALRVWFDNRV